MRTTYLRTSLMGMALLAVAACTDTGPVATGDVDITMQETSQFFAQVTGGIFASNAGVSDAAFAVDPDTVATLVVRITRIEALSANEADNEAQDGAWVSVTLGAPVLVDLTDLPTEGSSPLVIASGALAVGEYVNVRLFVDSAAITFTGTIAMGALTFDAGTTYQVTIPSGDQTGIKTDAAFTVTAGAGGTANDVDLLFSPTATFQNVTTTGAGTVILAPVIRSGGQGS